MENDYEDVLSGQVRPRLIPEHWLGEPLPDGRGWRWLDPEDRGNSVRFYRGDPGAENPVDREAYVVVTVEGEYLNRDGTPTG